MTTRHTIAFDRASVRTVDADGHLHVSLTPISKANVCPYYGREIPDFERLGLDPGKVYNLLRHPDELAKAAPTFAGKPLLLDHTPVSADDHPRGRTVGAVGEGVVWRPPYLMAPLTIWDGDAIRGIENGAQKELSSAYRFTPVMEPGTFEGERYDGRMTRIIGNHVALVVEGRAGKDVAVGDAKPRRRWDFSAFIVARDEAPDEVAAGEFRDELRKLAAGTEEQAWVKLAGPLRQQVEAFREALRAHTADPENVDRPEPEEGFSAELAALADSLDDDQWLSLHTMLTREARGEPWDEDTARIAELCEMAQDAAVAGARRAVFPSGDRLNPRHAGPKFPHQNRLLGSAAGAAWINR